MPSFAHLHTHTQYSLLDGAASISALYKKAQTDGMKALAITDHGNMFGVFQFVAEAGKFEGIKPIVGCEFYVVEDRHVRQFTKDKKDRRYHQLMLAKNATGYKNLVKLCSLGFIEGLYGKYPRIDKELILKYHEGLIATTCCLGAEVPQAILKKGEEEGLKLFKWWLDLFGEDYYVEIQRHGIGEQEKVNQVLLKWAEAYNVKVICTNDSHYVDEDNANAHDILLCINTGEKQSTPVFKDLDENNPMPKGSRFGFYNNQFYFKTQAEMGRLFHDVPVALDNTMEIVDKCEHLRLKQDILLPHFQVPANFNSQDDYLRHITFEGAKRKYGAITPEIEERLNFELQTITQMGFAGYFLIVSDFIKAGRDLGVFVGPGRGSAAGSAVAYCIGITNIDPIKYKLLFERFLNPDRKSMPDIDTDFDDEGRQKVIDYVVQKYGRDQVAHIVTYGTMAAKMSIKDVARVMDLPLDRSNYLAKQVPEKPGISLKRVLTAPIDGEKSLKEKEGVNSEDLEGVIRLRDIYAGKESELESRVLKEAEILEGSVRGTGIHAAGIIIAPKDLTEILPVCTNKDTELYITQYEGSIIEDAGVIKMDFLGLKTLTIIKEALRLIKQNHQIDIDIDQIPLDDPKTFELYQKGETNGTFQFESPGMQKYLRELRPDKFDDLIAMNALYRPGPLEYIPNFIARKHGREAITYDVPAMEEYLSDTYGITVYQEQVMLLSQSLAGFSKGDADVLRKAMGKKQKSVLDKMKSQFIEGAKAKGHPEDKLEKIWTDWEAFASYAFNKSHSTCYAFVAYQTAYLKAHYAAEYMAAVLTHNQNNIEKITFFMEECRRMGIPVKSPDVNESDVLFSVNSQGEIRYALSAIKGVGEAAVEAIVQERKANKLYQDVYDFMRRSNLRAINKKVVECLVMAGAFDGMGLRREQFFAPSDKFDSFTEHLIRYGNAWQSQQESVMNSLFGEIASSVSVPEPPAPEGATWSLIHKLELEREVCGIYLSGHPLDDYKMEMKHFVQVALNRLEDYKDRKISIGGLVTNAQHRISQRGTGYGYFTIQDFSGSLEFPLFSEDYQKWKHLLEPNQVVYITGTYAMRIGRDEYQFKIEKVQMLSELGSQKTDGISLLLPISLIDEKIIQELETLVKNHKGTQRLHIQLIDPVQRQTLSTQAKKYKVKVTNELITAVERLGLEYQLK